MQLFTTEIHPDIDHNSGNCIYNDQNIRLFKREATRAIVLKGEQILLLYTERYHDYTLPGGGIDEGEDKISALIRELSEETGAHNITNIKPFGSYEEYRPWYKDNADIAHMISYCYTCDIDDELKQTQLEDYEVSNGMKPVWMNIHQAIAHNEQTIKNSNKKGLSIIRETYLLKRIVSDLL